MKNKKILSDKINKSFIFKYEPQSSVREIFTHLEETIKTGKKYIQPKNVSITNDLTVISRILSKTRLEIFSVIREKQPNSVHKLAQLLHRDYANVWRDCQVLASCQIIKLKKEGKEIKPVVLYDQIVISYPEKLNRYIEVKIDSEMEQPTKQIQNHHINFMLDTPKYYGK
jgi:predicted transcriptional regulator